MSLNDNQQKAFDRLVELGTPEEWAYLIAERSNSALVESELHLINHAHEVLGFCVSWSRTPEGSDFWSGVYHAMASESRWKNENGHLTAEQVAWIDKMLSVGMPQDWAILIAERMNSPKRWKSETFSEKNLATFMNSGNSCSCLGYAFNWELSEEGHEFWEGVFTAFRSEEMDAW